MEPAPGSLRRTRNAGVHEANTYADHDAAMDMDTLPPPPPLPPPPQQPQAPPAASSSAAAPASSKKKPPFGHGSGRRPTKSMLRKGKWTAEEERYTECIISCFNKGYLPVAAGTTLRSYLSEELCCDPMRITKKFAGASCIGKQVFSPCDSRPDTLTQRSAARSALDALHAVFHVKLEEAKALERARGAGLGGAGPSSTRKNGAKSAKKAQGPGAASSAAARRRQQAGAASAYETDELSQPFVVPFGISNGFGAVTQKGGFGGSSDPPLRRALSTGSLRSPLYSDAEASGLLLGFFSAVETAHGDSPERRKSGDGGAPGSAKKRGAPAATSSGGGGRLGRRAAASHGDLRRLVAPQPVHFAALPPSLVGGGGGGGGGGDSYDSSGYGYGYEDDGGGGDDDIEQAPPKRSKSIDNLALMTGRLCTTNETAPPLPPPPLPPPR